MVIEYTYDFVESEGLSVDDLSKVVITLATDKNTKKQWVRVLKIDGDRRWILNNKTGWVETFVGAQNTYDELFEVL